MTGLTIEALFERTSRIERHLKRVQSALPSEENAFMPGTESSDSALLHMYFALQLALETALYACHTFSLGKPTSYADAFHKLAKAEIVDEELALRLSEAAALKFLFPQASAYKKTFFKIAKDSPSDILKFLKSLYDRLHAPV